MSVGAPLYEAVKFRQDDSALLDALEVVVTDSAFVADVQLAVHRSTLPPIPKRHLATAIGWVASRRYVDAYPPFYNGLEAAVRCAAQDSGVLDPTDRLSSSGRKITKIDNVFAGLFSSDPRLRRFMSAWIFGPRGNHFRHGDVDDPAECRRQSLRLVAAVVGWLEVYGGWNDPDFRERLEFEAERRLLETDVA